MAAISWQRKVNFSDHNQGSFQVGGSGGMPDDY